MDNILSLTMGQQIFVIAVNAWMYIIFPIIVFRKLNYISALLEADEEEEEDEREDACGTME